MRKTLKIKISDERAVQVYEDIARGSEPKFRFYNMDIFRRFSLATIGFLIVATIRRIHNIGKKCNGVMEYWSVGCKSGKNLLFAKNIFIIIFLKI